MKSNKSNLKYFILTLAFLSIFYTITNYIWIKKSSSVVTFTNEAIHTNLLATEYMGISKFHKPLYIITHGIYCPIYHLSAVFSNYIVGKGMMATKMTNIFWFMLTLWGIYLLSVETLKKQSGIYALWIFAFFPITFASSRLFLESFGLMAMVTFTILFLFKSKKFSIPLYSYLFGIFLGLSFMTKKSAIVFLFVPTLYSFSSLLQKTKQANTRRKNFLIGAAIFILIISFRYFRKEYLEFLFTIPFEEAKTSNSLLGPSLKVFVLGMINYQLSLPFFILFLYGALKFFKSYESSYNKIIFASWIICPLLFFTLMPHKPAIRFIIPYLPAIAIISAYGLSSIKNKQRRSITAIFIAILSLIQFYDLSFGGIGLEKLQCHIGNMKIYYFNLHDHNELYSLNKRAERDETFSDIYKAIKDKQLTRPKILLWGHMMYQFRNYFLFNDITAEPIYLPIHYNYIPDLLKHIQEADFIIFQGNIRKGIETYIEQEVDIIKEYNMEHFKKDQAKSFEDFLRNDYHNHVIKIKSELLNYKFNKAVKSRHNNYYLFERIDKNIGDQN